MGARDRDAFTALKLDWVRTPEDVWRSSGVHVDGIHPDATRAIGDAINEVAVGGKIGGNPMGLVVQGQAGTGKTHLLGWVRERTHAAGGYFFLVGPLGGGTPFWDAVLASIVEGLTRQTPDGDTQLLAFLRRLTALIQAPPAVTEMVTGTAPFDQAQLKDLVIAVRDHDRVIGRDCQDTLRALVLFGSDDYEAEDVGRRYLLSMEEQFPHERSERGMRSAPTPAKQIVRELTRLLALTGPTVIAVDQIDTVLAETQIVTASAPSAVGGKLAAPVDGAALAEPTGASGPAETVWRIASPAVSQVADGLLGLRDETARTLCVLTCLPSSWELIDQQAVASVRDRFRLIRPLNVIGTPELAARFVELRFRERYAAITFTPPYPTWPVRPQALRDAADYTPRALLQRIDRHVQACLASGEFVELVDLDVDEQPKIVDRPRTPALDPEHATELDAEFQRLRADHGGLATLNAANEDAEFPRLLSAALRAWISELGEDAGPAFQVEPFPSAKPYLHARLRRVLNESTSDEVHWSFRAVLAHHPATAITRLQAARQAAGLGATADGSGAGQRRHLVILRDDEWSKGSKTQNAVDAFSAVGGITHFLADDDVRTFAALHGLLARQHPALDAWLAVRRPASSSALLSSVLGEVFDTLAPPRPDGPPPVVAPRPTTPRPTAPATSPAAPDPPTGTAPPQVQPSPQAQAPPRAQPPSGTRPHSDPVPAADAGAPAQARPLVETVAPAEAAQPSGEQRSPDEPQPTLDEQPSWRTQPSAAAQPGADSPLDTQPSLDEHPAPQEQPSADGQSSPGAQPGAPERPASHAQPSSAAQAAPDPRPSSDAARSSGGRAPSDEATRDAGAPANGRSAGGTGARGGDGLAGRERATRPRRRRPWATDPSSELAAGTATAEAVLQPIPINPVVSADPLPTTGAATPAAAPQQAAAPAAGGTTTPAAAVTPQPSPVPETPVAMSFTGPEPHAEALLQPVLTHPVQPAAPTPAGPARGAAATAGSRRRPATAARTPSAGQRAQPTSARLVPADPAGDDQRNGQRRHDAPTPTATGHALRIKPSTAQPPTDPAVIEPADASGPGGHGALITLGMSERTREPVRLHLAVLRRHIAIFAGSGSGKTVLIRRLVEECALRGVSSIVLDPNNDLARLGDPWPAPPAGWGPGDAAAAAEYLANTDVVVWTPRRLTGRPLSFQPLPDFAGLRDDPDELAAALDTATAALAARADVAGTTRRANVARAVLREALRYFAHRGGHGLVAFLELLADLPDGVTTLDNSQRIAKEVEQSLRAAMVNDPMFGGHGDPIDPSVLLTPAPGRRARVSVINLAGLPEDEQRQSFVAQLQMALFAWAKRNPAANRPLGGLLVMDEAQTFAPANGSTPCVASTLALASQARKYGLGLVFATQAPKGLHNQISGNATTQFFGRLHAPVQIDTAREMAKVRGGDAPDIGRLGVGEFYATSEGIDFQRITAPLCLSYHPSSPLTAEEVLARAKRS